jgi:PKHD-type hydroxylase
MIFFNTPTQNLFNYFSFFDPLEESTINSIFDIVSNLEFQEGTINEPLDYRRSQIKWIELNNSSQELYRHLELLVSVANQDYYNFNISYSKDSLQYTEYYGSNEGKYGWHMDTSPDSFSPRKLSLIAQLSDPDEYAGGELQIKLYDIDNTIITIPKQKGLVTIFPSYMWHRVTPTTKGTRKSLVWWVGGSQFM